MLTRLNLLFAVALATYAPMCAAANASSPGTGQNAEGDSLAFSLDSFKGMNFEITVRNTNVLYRCLPYGSELLSRWSSFSVSQDKSASLFSDLKRLGALKWRERYVEPVADGEGWSFRARMGGQVVHSFGSNDQPGEFGLVVERVRQFLGGLPFGFSGVIEAPPENCLNMTGPLRNGISTHGKSRAEP